MFQKAAKQLFLFLQAFWRDGKVASLHVGCQQLNGANWCDELAPEFYVERGRAFWRAMYQNKVTTCPVHVRQLLVRLTVSQLDVCMNFVCPPHMEEMGILKQVLSCSFPLHLAISIVLPTTRKSDLNLLVPRAPPRPLSRCLSICRCRTERPTQVFNHELNKVQKQVSRFGTLQQVEPRALLANLVPKVSIYLLSNRTICL